MPIINARIAVRKLLGLLGLSDSDSAPVATVARGLVNPATGGLAAYINRGGALVDGNGAVIGAIPATMSFDGATITSNGSGIINAAGVKVAGIPVSTAALYDFATSALSNGNTASVTLGSESVSLVTVRTSLSTDAVTVSVSDPSPINGRQLIVSTGGSSYPFGAITVSFPGSEVVGTGSSIEFHHATNAIVFICQATASGFQWTPLPGIDPFATPTLQAGPTVNLKTTGTSAGFVNTGTRSFYVTGFLVQIANAVSATSSSCQIRLEDNSGNALTPTITLSSTTNAVGKYEWAAVASPGVSVSGTGAIKAHVIAAATGTTLQANVYAQGYFL